MEKAKTEKHQARAQQTGLCANYRLCGTEDSVGLAYLNSWSLQRPFHFFFSILSIEH